MDKTSLETKAVTTATDLDTLKRCSCQWQRKTCYMSLFSGQGGKIEHNCTVTISLLINAKTFTEKKPSVGAKYAWFLRQLLI